MKTFLIPVVYQMYGKIEVEANTEEEAFKWAEDNIDLLPLPDPNCASYLEDSFEIDTDGIAIEVG